MRLVNIGFGNMIDSEKVCAIVTPDSAPSKRLVQEARNNNMLINATQGRKIRAILILENGMAVVSALNPETISSRCMGKNRILTSEEENNIG
jgi:regulator of extracellular matrix RemA (YlzA/DUF370 family)